MYIKSYRFPEYEYYAEWREPYPDTFTRKLYDDIVLQLILGNRVVDVPGVPYSYTVYPPETNVAIYLRGIQSIRPRPAYSATITDEEKEREKRARQTAYEACYNCLIEHSQEVMSVDEWLGICARPIQSPLAYEKVDNTEAGIRARDCEMIPLPVTFEVARDCVHFGVEVYDYAAALPLEPHAPPPLEPEEPLEPPLEPEEPPLEPEEPPLEPEEPPLEPPPPPEEEPERPEPPRPPYVEPGDIPLYDPAVTGAHTYDWCMSTGSYDANYCLHIAQLLGYNPEVVLPGITHPLPPIVPADIEEEPEVPEVPIHIPLPTLEPAKKAFPWWLILVGVGAVMLMKE